jgi:energy-converting hydrogenase B subunit D
MSALLVLFDLLLTLTLLGLAVVTLTSREPRRAVILFIAFGLMLALVWARLRAPDLALAEAAIGAGLSGALMLAAARRASSRKTSPAESGDAEEAP